MKFFISLLLSLSTVAFAQTKNKPAEFNTVTGIAYESNLIRNPSARFRSDLYRTISNMNLGQGVAVYENIGSWSIQATATSAYVEFEMLTPSGELKVGNCVFNGYYTGSASTYKAQILDGSAVELNSLQLSDVSAITYFEVTYPCGASRKVRFTYTSTGTGSTFEAGKLNYGKYTSQTVPDGASFVGSLKYASTSGCNWTKSTTSWGSYSVTAACPTPTTKGNVTAPGTKIPGLVLPAGLPPGRYVFTATGAFYKNSAAADVAGFRFSDGTNNSSGQSVFNSAASSQVPVIVGEITYSTSLSSATTVQIQSISTAATSAAIDVQSTLIPDLEIQVVRYPLNGTAYSNVIPASCINNPDCQNNFSAKVAAANTVSDENSDFINGNCAVTDTSLYTCTFVTGRFSVEPNCTVSIAVAGDAAATPNSIAIDENASDATKLVYRISYNSAKTAIPARIACSRAGTDVKPWGPIPLLGGMLSSDGTGSYQIESAEISTTGVKSGMYSAWLSGNCTVASTNQFTCPFTKTQPVNPECWGQCTASNCWQAMRQTVSTTSVRMDTANNAGGAVAGSFTLFCKMQR